MLLRRLTVRRAATSSMFGGRVVVPPSPLAATTTASALRASVHALPAPATTASMHPLSASAHFSTSTLRAAPTSAAAVKALRTATGAPISECKAALDACGGVEEAAIDWLRKKGLAAAAKKAGRTAAQGIVAVAAAPSDFPAPEAACMVELNSETDFVARNALFQALAGQVAKVALSLPGPASESASITAPSGAAPFSDEEMDALKAMPMGEGDFGKSNVNEAVTDLIGKIRENMMLRRGAALRVPGGWVSSYVHNSIAPGMGAIGVLCGMRVAGVPFADLTEEQRAKLTDMSRKVCMHIAAAKPAYLSRDHVPPEAITRERGVLLAQVADSGKPADIVEKVVTGRMSKFYADSTLLEQPYILAEKETPVKRFIADAAKAAGVKQAVEVVAFHHFVLGDGVQPSSAE